ncbi:MAG: hypothetical protein AVDCRST_MAG39-2817 [uncultured Sphingomonadaceae bacterium]|uniref:Lipoprotein n=1 Tax=uncultured Sphingomonadaceae bacterium TaxID=169976 RepID=A0A6J4TH57_9SPHN|nr:MAG: hypothetical protein AVDCRST_MAG39-2817 [uncultured Sphingomonadaceae bacterium]
MRKKLVAALAAALLAGGCAGGVDPLGLSGGFRLVQEEPRDVARSAMVVAPDIRWNRFPRTRNDINREENWTLNGPLLDGVSFLGGVENGRNIVRQRRKEDRQVPRFRSDMQPQEIASLIESFYRVRGGSTEFAMTNLEPRLFLGRTGFQFDYDHLTGDEVRRRGRAVGAVVDGRLYMILWDAARSHYYGAGLPHYERLVTSARLRG